MILSKLFMGLGIGLTKTFRTKTRFLSRKYIVPWRWRNILSNSQFRATSSRLLLSYLLAMIVVMGLSSMGVYHFFAYSLYQQLDHQLLTLADAAAHNLSSIQADRTAVHRKMPRILDHDGDLDIPWQDLRLYNQSVEWFDHKKQLLGKAGKQFPQVPFVTSFQSWHKNQIRTLTIPVYFSEKNRQVLGYVRVSASTTEVQKELNRLLIGLGFGGVLGMVLIGGTGWWLTSKALQPIEQSFQKLQQFTADASHELRSPLTAIKTTVEVMQSHPERHPSDSKKIAIIEGATRQMTHLVEDLLLLARNDSADVNLPTIAIPIPIDEILWDLIASLQPQAQENKITLEISLESDFTKAQNGFQLSEPNNKFFPHVYQLNSDIRKIQNPQTDEVWVKGNANQIQRLFVNLLENALQYTPGGGLVKVKIMKSDNFVMIEVADTGIGIASEHLPLVFNRFWRADKARSRRHGGSGLGLAIAQAITHAHGGEISVKSQLGVGSCFRVKLPVFE
ncbi:sensor histidine kinase [Sphaerospermopsis aphanizomenoides BCCUSP55]|uniref:sensor histidine kinase n=1 Tax=Sphaerospermopsis aphanizomenoides TaxID=459663 RepID=UPI001904EF61|nr:HAMP domain-containing sensor histidine kinase [Sphaerospermopsis aphanizomenoides]MBK1986279.1 sensor histidine kinase [Sphaerospermopsis aphanizomenoides BCCUSP55]